MAQIDLCGVSVTFPILNVNARSLKKQFLRLATGGSIVEDANKHVIVNALNNINLTLRHGDRVGLIGHNGSGKSTLLRLLAAIYEPTLGHVAIHGHVSSLLDVGVGMETEFTGYENIYTRGILMGLTRRQIQKNIDQIAETTGLGDYLAMPVRTYSTGMQVRLAFAISTHINPDILLLDEIFAAGDADFIKNAKERMASLMNQSSIMIMATHDDDLILEFCNKAILLNNGTLAYVGEVKKALALYHQR